MNLIRDLLKSQSGFTLIELLTAIAIMGALAGMGMTAFFVYQKDAYYVRAAADLGNARRAAFVGLNDNPDGFNVAFAWTNTVGGLVPNQLQQAMPGGATSPDVRLGAQFVVCAAEDMTPQMFIVSQPCRGDKYARYTRFCNGIEVLEQKIARDYVCGG